MNSKHLAKLQNHYFLASLATIVIALASLIRSPVFNYDATLYLRVATLFNEQGFHAARELYSWPFYSILIAVLSKLSHLSVLTSAHIIDISLQIVITLVFMLLVKQLGGNRRTQIFAALIVLIYPYLSEYRGYISRDYGFWAFYLIAVYQFLKYIETYSWQNAVFWGCSIGLAFLFRIEAIVYWSLVPLVILILPQQKFPQRIYHYLLANVIIFMGALAIYLWLRLHPNEYLYNMGRFNHLLNVYYSGKQDLINRVSTVINEFRQHALDSQSASNATKIILYGMLGYYVTKIIKVVSPLYSILAGHAIITKKMPASLSQKLVLFSFILANIIFTSYFFAFFMFLSGRYLLALAFILMCWAPFSLEYFYELFLQQKKRLLFAGISVCLTVMLVDDFYSTMGSKRYINQAAYYLKANLNQQDRVYTNNVQILYLSKGAIDTWDQDYAGEIAQVNLKQLHNYAYAAIKVNGHKDPNINFQKQLGIKPVQVFQNNKSRVEIYRIADLT